MYGFFPIGINKPENGWTKDLSADEMSKFMLTATTPEDWASVLATNTTSPYFLVGAFIPLLAKAADVDGHKKGNVCHTNNFYLLMKKYFFLM